MRTDNLYQLPPDLPVPVDDGAARHLLGMELLPIALPSTDGGSVRLDDAAIPLAVVYCYPRTGRPDAHAPGGTEAWNALPGARGCTPQSCAYRDHHQELQRLGAKVYGLSTQTTEYQREAVSRLRLPFALLSDAAGELTAALRLPWFEVAGERLLKRLTLVIEHGHILHCIYPVFPPDKDAETVINWIGDHSPNQAMQRTADRPFA
ncbi:MAG: peroxiredoxin [Chthoniobacterales bacterium]